MKSHRRILNLIGIDCKFVKWETKARGFPTARPCATQLAICNRLPCKGRRNNQTKTDLPIGRTDVSDRRAVRRVAGKWNIFSISSLIESGYRNAAESFRRSASARAKRFLRTSGRKRVERGRERWRRDIQPLARARLNHEYESTFPRLEFRRHLRFTIKRRRFLQDNRLFLPLPLSLSLSASEISIINISHNMYYIT